MRLAAGLALAIATAGALAADGLAVYHNSRFGYSVDYPADLLVPQGEAANGDGQVFKAKKGDATLTVFGQYLMKEIHAQCDAVATARSFDDAHITYKVEKPNLSIASGYRKPGVVFYLRKVKAAQTCLSLELAYPIEDRGTFDSQVARISMY